MLYYLFIIYTAVVTLCLGIYIASLSDKRMFLKNLSNSQIKDLQTILPLFNIGRGLHMVEMAKDYSLRKVLPLDYFENSYWIEYIEGMSSRACDIIWFSMYNLVHTEAALDYARKNNKHMYHLNSVRSFDKAAIKEFIISCSLIIYNIFSTLYKSGCLNTSIENDNLVVNVRLRDYNNIDSSACVLFLILGYCDQY